MDWQQASEGRLPASKSRLRSDSGLLSVEAVTASCLLFTADTWLRAVLVSRHERGGGWEGVCMSSAARGVDPCTKTCRSGVAAGSRSGAKNRHSFRCGLFLVGFFASAGLPWWLRLRGQPETLRRSSRSYRNTNLSQKRPVFHTLLLPLEPVPRGAYPRAARERDYPACGGFLRARSWRPRKLTG